jgi:hypothetical protein
VDGTNTAQQQVKKKKGDKSQKEEAKKDVREN